MLGQQIERGARPGIARRLETNVEYYTALVLHGVGLESELFTPIFAVSGWPDGRPIRMEQAADGRLLRPRAAYVDQDGRSWAGSG